MSAADDAIFADLFAAEGAQTAKWYVGTRCTCYSDDSRQPDWNHEPCGGYGVLYAVPVEIPAIFRGQSRWISPRREGEIDHGEASITVPTPHRPGYTDRRVRDRYTINADPDTDSDALMFYVAAPPVPFLFDNVQYAWRVQVTALDQADLLVPQP